MTGATINKNGTLRVRATKVGADTALAQIVKLVQEAQNSKAPGQRLAGRAAFWLVLVALTGGAVTLAAWLLAGRPIRGEWILLDSPSTTATAAGDAGRGRCRAPAGPGCSHVFGYLLRWALTCCSSPAADRYMDGYSPYQRWVP